MPLFYLDHMWQRCEDGLYSTCLSHDMLLNGMQRKKHENSLSRSNPLYDSYGIKYQKWSQVLRLLFVIHRYFFSRPYDLCNYKLASMHDSHFSIDLGWLHILPFFSSAACNLFRLKVFGAWKCAHYISISWWRVNISFYELWRMFSFSIFFLGFISCQSLVFSPLDIYFIHNHLFRFKSALLRLWVAKSIYGFTKISYSLSCNNLYKFMHKILSMSVPKDDFVEFFNSLHLYSHTSINSPKKIHLRNMVDLMKHTCYLFKNDDFQTKWS